MEFWTEKGGTLNAITKQIEENPVYEERFSALSDIRNEHVEHAARVHSLGDQWMRVASVVGPLLDVARILEPDFLQNKKRFYGWLDEHPGFCAYDRRRGRSK